MSETGNNCRPVKEDVMQGAHRQRRPRSAAKLGLTMLVIALVGVVAAIGTWSAFSSVTTNPSNSFTAGSVTLTDNDAGSAMFNVMGMVPGSTDTGCIKVSYTGTVTSNVRLYGTTGGTGLDQYLDVKVTRGVYTPSDPSFDSCTNFSADATNYIGAGAGVIYNGTLQAYADTYSAGLVDPTSGSPEAWTNPENHVYKFEITLQSSAPNAAQGLTATEDFTWEARNV
jgi:predicted ribosomally synthesized peptide with SipW-like signal peptide